jgi:hypothetical protein
MSSAKDRYRAEGYLAGARMAYRDCATLMKISAKATIAADDKLIPVEAVAEGFLICARAIVSKSDGLKTVSAEDLANWSQPQ